MLSQSAWNLLILFIPINECYIQLMVIWKKNSRKSSPLIDSLKCISSLNDS